MEGSAIEFLDLQHPTPNFMNNSPLGMNLIPLDSWHRAQEPPCVGFRIGCMAVVECSSCGPGVWMLDQWPQTGSVDVECCDEKIVSCRVLFEAKCRETTRH